MAGVAFYISGHGFGHASRQIEIVNALGAASPATSILIRTSAPRWLFERTLRVPATLVSGEIDTGVVQIDSLHLDAAETIRRAAAFYQTLDDRARAEADLLRAHRISCVVADAPPLGCAAAHAAGIESIVISNFTWDWIYDGYAEELRSAPELRETLRRDLRAGCRRLATADVRRLRDHRAAAGSAVRGAPRATCARATCDACAGCHRMGRSRCCRSAATGCGTST